MSRLACEHMCCSIRNVHLSQTILTAAILIPRASENALSERYSVPMAVANSSQISKASSRWICQASLFKDLNILTVSRPLAAGRFEASISFA